MENGVRKIEANYDFGRIVVTGRIGEDLYTISYWGNDKKFALIKALIPSGKVTEASVGNYDNKTVRLKNVEGIPSSILNHQTEISDLIRQFNSQTIIQ